MLRKACDNRKIKLASARGVTLVELVVVLVILSIIAGAGVGAAIGFVKRSQFTRNQKNAETVYQAVQTALLQKAKAGTISSWVENEVLTHAVAYEYSSSNVSSNTDLESRFTASEFNALNDSNAKPNDSVHMRYCLTFDPSSASNEQSTVVYELLKPYFYDASVFNGTMTIELDVEKAFDTNKVCRYSASCLSVFYSSRCKEGWDATAMGSASTVPARDYEYRKETSLVGYFDGYAGSSVDTVYLPAVEEGINIGKFYFDKKTLSLCWSSSLDSENLNGSDKHVYYRINLNDTASTCLILNEDFVTDGLIIGSSVSSGDCLTLLEGVTSNGKVTFDSKEYDVTVSSRKHTYVDTGRVSTVISKSFTVDATLYKGAADYASVTPSGMASDMVTLPLTITYVAGEYDSNDLPVDPYIIYSLDITDYMAGNPQKATLLICPNAFSSDQMKLYNDTTGIVAMRTGVETNTT